MFSHNFETTGYKNLEVTLDINIKFSAHLLDNHAIHEIYKEGLPELEIKEYSSWTKVCTFNNFKHLQL